VWGQLLGKLEGDPMLDGVECRLLRTTDREEAVALMLRTGVHFAGTRSLRVLRAVTADAARGSAHVRIALALVHDVPRGLVVSFIQRSLYWRTFAVRHPVAAVEMTGRRLARMLRRRLSQSARPQAPSSRAQQARRLVEDRIVTGGIDSWHDESPSIAKVMYVAVDPDYRKDRIGTTLYRWFFRDLATAGFARCDACVSSENLAALTLHRRFPFRFADMRGGYFLWLSPRDVE
jgi:GNAT superfamily N-acetyltransferase